LKDINEKRDIHMTNTPVDFNFLAEEVKLCELTGVKVKDFYNDIELMVNTQKKAVKIISETLEIPPPNYLFCYGHVKTAEVMGCSIYYPDNDEPSVRKGVLNDIKQVNDFEVPYPEDNPVVKDLLTKSKRFYDLTGTKDTITFEGPFTVAGFIRGQTDFLLDIKDSPHLCEKLISKITNAAIEWKKYHDSEMGINDDESIALIDDSITNISPETFEEIVLPHLLQWYEAFPAPKRHFHCCGNIDNFLKPLKKLRLATYDYMGEMVNLKKAKKAFRGVYISRLLNFRIIRDKSKDDITKYLINELKTGSKGNNFGVCLEGQRGVPLSKVRIVRDIIFDWNGGKINTFDKSRGI
jgi:uroporphyrinogen-III decarboxylase